MCTNVFHIECNCDIFKSLSTMEDLKKRIREKTQAVLSLTPAGY